MTKVSGCDMGERNHIPKLRHSRARTTKILHGRATEDFRHALAAGETSIRKRFACPKIK
jgi:hypothetical protein